MNVLSLFSGIGGLELGLERAGMTVVGQVEISEYCRRVLAKHWPEVPRHDDVHTAVDWWRSESRPAVHVVCGGFPCQPFSLAGQRRQQADDRWLWPATWAVIRDLRPDFAILENVPGLLAGGMGDVLGDLATGGYDAEWDCIPAAAVGAPHRRDRVFIVAHAGSTRRRQDARSAPSNEATNARWAAEHDHVSHRDGEGGRARNVADADGASSAPPRFGFGEGSASTMAAGAPEPRRRNSDLAGAVADTDREPTFRAPIPRSQRDHWTTEPDVGRVANGIPRRLDRLRALGNAVVPQVAEHIGRLVMAAAS